MKTENINHAFLDGILDGSQTDFYYHFGLSSDDPLLEKMREVRAIITAGPGSWSGVTDRAIHLERHGFPGQAGE